MSSKGLDYTLLTLVIIGAINWGLIGFFRFDLVAFLFGTMSWFSRVIYALVGISGIYLISVFGRIRSMKDLSNRLSKKGVLSILRT
mgnify:CR=1 FL=1